MQYDEDTDPLTVSDAGLARTVRLRMLELGANTRECADLLQMIKDPRIAPEIEDELEAVLSGAIRAPGTLLASLTALLRIHRRAVLRNASTKWSDRHDMGVISEDDSIRATTDDGYRIAIIPRTRGRWQNHIVDPLGRALTWRIWLDDLEAAKIKALMEIEGDLDSDRELQQGY